MEKTYINHGLFGLHHVGDYAVCDHEQDEVLRAVRHTGCGPVGEETEDIQP